jgi:nitroreductase
MHQHTQHVWEIAANQYPSNGSLYERLTFLLSYAILAPSSHNTQPWLFQITDEGVALYADRSQAMPIVDPAQRELTISCGAATAQLVIALRHFGFTPTIRLLPDADQPNLLAQIQITPASSSCTEDAALFPMIPQRHTNRLPFTTRAIPADLLNELQQIAKQEAVWLQFVEDDTIRASICDLIANGDRIQWADPRFRRELAAGIRSNGLHHYDSVASHMQNMPALYSLLSPFMIRTFNPGEKQAEKQRQLALAAPTLVILGTTGDSIENWIAAGQALTRVLLRATAEGVSASFFNQPIEVPMLRAQLCTLLGTSGIPQLIIRLGYGSSVPPTPRRPVSSVLLPSDASVSRRTSRRHLLAGVGAGTLVFLMGGLAWRAQDQGVWSTGQGPAYQPWSDWHSATTGPLNLVRAAILAANAHNTQPWLFHVTDTRIDLYADTSRHIGLADPFLSELHIGLGCALESILLAAPANGYRPHLTLFPDLSDATHIAQVDLSPGEANVSDLYLAIPHRHTNRYPYDPHHLVTQTTLDALTALNTDPLVRLFWVTSAASQKQVGDNMIAAAHAFVADSALITQDNHWYRATWQEVQKDRDGITLDAAGLPDWERALAKMLPPASGDQQNSAFLQGIQTQVQSAGVLGILAVPNKRDNLQRISIGRLWQRMHLWATVHGLGMQPLNQMTEMADREVMLQATPHFGDVLGDLVGDSSWQVIFTFRAGYATHAALLSPRRSMSAVVMPQ